MSQRTKQLLCEGLPAGRITMANLRSTFENKLQQQNGKVVDIAFTATNSVIISFERPEAVESILKGGSSVEIGSTRYPVQAYYGTDEETAAKNFMQSQETGTNLVWRKGSKSGKQKISDEEQPRPAPKSHSLLIEGLPSKGMSEDRLKFFFKNRRNRVPGKVISVSYDPAANSAIVVFEQFEAVEFILSRGPSVELDSTHCTVQAIPDAKKETLIDNSFRASEVRKAPLNFETEDVSWKFQEQNEEKQTEIFWKKKIDTPSEKHYAGRDTSDNASTHEEKQTDIFWKEKIGALSEKHYARRDIRENASIRQNIQASSVKDTILKIQVKNVFKSRDSYVLYLESINQQLEIDEENMILDAVNGFVYVPFLNMEDVLHICHEKHTDANILEVSMTTKEDLDFYENCVSLHTPSLLSLSIEEMKSFVNQQTGEKVINVYQEDEPRSVVFIFDKSSKKACTLTWDLCKKEGDKVVIAAPVQKTKSVLVQNVQDMTDLNRYMSNKKRSQGGEIESVEHYKAESYIVNFKTSDSATSVLQKEQHKLNGNILQVNFFFHCLSAKNWKRYFEEKTDHVEDVHFQDQVHQQLKMEEVKEKNGAKEKDNFRKEVQIICEIDELKTHMVAVKVLKGTAALLIVNEALTNSMRKSNVIMLFENDTSEFDTIILKFDFPQKVKAHVCKNGLRESVHLLVDQIKSMTAFKYTGSSPSCMGKFRHEFIEWKKHPQYACPDGVKVIFYPNSPEFVLIGPKAEAEHFNNKLCHFFGIWLNKRSEMSWHCPPTNEPVCLEGLHQNEWLRLKENQGKELSVGDVATHHKATASGGHGGVQAQQNFDQEAEKVSSEIEAANEQTEIQMPVDESEYETKKINVDQHKLVLFNLTNFQETFMQENKNVSVVLDMEAEAVVLKANKKSIETHYAKLMKQMHEHSLKFPSAKVGGLDESTLKLIQNEHFQAKFQMLMNASDCLVSLEYLDDGINIRCAESERKGALEKARSVLHNLSEEKTLHADHVMILESKTGKEFISQLCSTTKADCVNVKFDRDASKVIVTGLAEMREPKIRQLESFLKRNEIATIKVPFSQGKKEYIAKFLNKAYDELVSDLTKAGAQCHAEKGVEAYVLKGLKDAVKEGEMKLRALLNKIFCQETVEQFYGIKEFLSETTGQQLLKQAEKHSCLAIRKTSSNATSTTPKGFRKQPLQLPTLIARSTFKNCGIDILQGDITAIQGVEAVVVPLPRSLQCTSGVSRAISDKGGPKIQSKLNDFDPADVEDGQVLSTTGGQLSYSSVYHIVCPVWNGEPEARNVLMNGLKESLRQASSNGHSSVVISTLGTGMFKFPASIATMMIKNAIENHLRGMSNLKRILLCDMTDSNVTEFKNRCEHWGLEEVNDVKLSHPKGSVSDHYGHGYNVPAPTGAKSSGNETKDGRGPRGQGHRTRCNFHFGQIRVNVISGEITKQKTDAIVTTVDKSLDLSKGRVSQAVLKYGGDSVQDDLQSNFPDGIKSGQFATSIGGDLQCQIIFHACLSRFSGSDTSKVESLVYDILKACADNKVTTISFSALGTGKLGYPADLCAQSTLKAISKLAKNHPENHLKAVTIVIFPSSDDVKAAFSAALSGDSVSPANIPKKDNKQTFGSLKVLVKKGDLLQEPCDAIVCGIKDSMNLGSSGAVGKVVLSKCGQDLQDSCFDEQANMQQDGVAAVSVEGLKCQHIIFVSMDKFSQHWDKGVTAVLKTADDLGLKTVAFPALGAGAKRANLTVIKKLIFSALESYGKQTSISVKDVKVVIFDDKTLAAFLGSHQSAPSPVKASPKHTIDHHQEMNVKSTVSDKETLQFLYVKAEACQTAQVELNSNLVKAFQSNTIQEKDLMKLSDAQVKKLEMEGRRLRTTVKVDKHAGVVTLRSFWPKSLYELTSHVHNSILEVLKGHHESIAKLVPLAIQWQYERNGKMKDFDKQLSITIEAAFKKKSQDIEIVDSKNRKFKVVFGSMKKFPVDEDGTVSTHGITIKRVDLTQGGEPLPKRWDPMKDSENLKVVIVKPGSPEYTNVESSFKAKGATQPIKKIERIQNKALYRQYIVKKKLMDSTNPKGHRNEERLYHGTDSATVQAVNENGFNRNYCGKNATAYGEGVYFAQLSSYSVSYARPESGTGDRKIYQARVLVGESTPSSSGMRFLPNKPGSNTPYDSGTGSTGMYIIFHDSQTYPEYLITF